MNPIFSVMLNFLEAVAIIQGLLQLGQLAYLTTLKAAVMYRAIPASCMICGKIWPVGLCLFPAGRVRMAILLVLVTWGCRCPVLDLRGIGHIARGTPRP